MLKGCLLGGNLIFNNIHKKGYCNTIENKKVSETIKDVSKFQFKSRDEHLKEVKFDPNFDVLIIGGGATGAGVLLESSRKGLKALLIEANDFSGGSSSKSTKLLHGGIRYLENAFKLRNKNRQEDFELVEESINERNLLLNNAPYLTNGVGIVIPTTNIIMGMYYYLGASIYENFNWKNLNFKKNKEKYPQDLPFKLPSPEIMGKTRLQSMFPNLHKKYKYGVLLWDGQVDDSKLVVDSILTSTAFVDPSLKQNNALNFMQLKSFIKDDKGRITGANLYDKVNLKDIRVQAKVVVNATGIMADKIRKMANEKLPAMMLASKGDHLTLENDDDQIFNSQFKHFGLLFNGTKDGRLMFLLPWQNTIIAGTTDKIETDPSISPTSDFESGKEIYDLIVSQFNGITPKVLSKWSGYRPLVYDWKKEQSQQKPDEFNQILTKPEISTSNIQSKDVKRVHHIEVDKASGLISAMGGKLTIYRLMGEDCMRSVLQQLKESGAISADKYEQMQTKSTRNLRLLGDFRSKVYDFELQKTQARQTKSEYFDDLLKAVNSYQLDLSGEEMEYLITIYGHRAMIILNKFKKDNSKMKKLHQSYPYSIGEIEHICESEFVTNPVDLITNRLRISFKNAEDAKNILPVVVEIFGNLKGWDQKKKKEEYEFNEKCFKIMGF